MLSLAAANAVFATITASSTRSIFTCPFSSMSSLNTASTGSVPIARAASGTVTPRTVPGAPTGVVAEKGGVPG